VLLSEVRNEIKGIKYFITSIEKGVEKKYKRSQMVIDNNINYRNEEMILKENKLVQNELDKLYDDIKITLFSTLNVIKDKDDLVYKLQSLKDADKYIDYLYVGYKDKSFYITDNEPIPSSYDPRTRDWYKYWEGKTDWLGNEVYVTDMYLDATNKTKMITMSIPIIKNKKLEGVIGADVVLDSLAKDLEGIKIFSKGFVVLTDKKGVILSSRDKNLVGKDINKTNLLKSKGYIVKKVENKNLGFTIYSFIFENDLVAFNKKNK